MSTMIEVLQPREIARKLLEDWLRDTPGSEKEFVDRLIDAIIAGFPPITPLCEHCNGPAGDKVVFHRDCLPKYIDQQLSSVPPPEKGQLLVGTNHSGEVVITHPDVDPDRDGVGHIVFSPREARGLAVTLVKKAAEAESQP